MRIFLRPVLHHKLRAVPGVLLLWVLCSTPLQAQQHVRAGWVETLLEGSETLRNYSGGVSYADSSKGIFIASDSVHVRVQSAFYAFVKGVVYRDSVREVRADTLVYKQKSHLAEFRGRVQLHDDGRTLSGNRIDYDVEERLLDASGSVRMAQTEKKQSLTANFVHYALDADSGWAQGSAQLQLSGADSDTLFARADSVTFAQGASHLELTGGVRIFQNRLQAEADAAIYADSLMVLTGTPTATWLGAHGDSVRATADSMAFVLADRRVREVRFYRQVNIRMAVADSQHTVRTVLADTALIGLRGDSLAALGAQGNVRAAITGKGKEDMHLSGQAIALAFAHDEPDSLVLNGDAESTYVPEDGASRNRLTGHEQIMWFRNRHLARALVIGEARCEHTPDRGDRVLLSGDRLRLAFRDGDLHHIDAEGGVRGQYRHKEKKP